MLTIEDCCCSGLLSLGEDGGGGRVGIDAQLVFDSVGYSD